MSEGLESYDERLAEIDARKAKAMARYHVAYEANTPWTAATEDAKRAIAKELRSLGEEWSEVHTQKYRALRGIPANAEKD